MLDSSLSKLFKIQTVAWVGRGKGALLRSSQTLYPFNNTCITVFAVGGF